MPRWEAARLPFLPVTISSKCQKFILFVDAKMIDESVNLLHVVIFFPFQNNFSLCSQVLCLSTCHFLFSFYNKHGVMQYVLAIAVTLARFDETSLNFSFRRWKSKDTTWSCRSWLRAAPLSAWDMDSVVAFSLWNHLCTR